MKDFTMSKLTEKQINDAFVTIRVRFEKSNPKGLDMLESIEKQWVANNHLSDGQLAWLERQLDGSWKQYDAEPGKIVVDAESLDELEKAFDGLKRTVRAIR